MITRRASLIVFLLHVTRDDVLALFDRTLKREDFIASDARHLMHDYHIVTTGATVAEGTRM